MDELRNSEDNALPFARAGGSEVNLQRAYQQYQVYLNNEFVGHKSFMKQVEVPDEIGEYLERSIYGHFETEVDGSHYKIYALDTSVTRDIRTQLTPYLDTHDTGATSGQTGF